MSFKFFGIAFLCCCAVSIKAQTFDIEQTSQLIRPRMKLDSRQTLANGNRDTAGAYNCMENSLGFTFPIKRTFKTEINLDLKDFKLKDLFKKNIRIKANEILGTFKMADKVTNFGVQDSMIKKDIFYINAGIIGLHLTQKFRILFYSVNMNVHEDAKTFNVFVPRFSAIVGQYHIRGLRKGFYYGISTIYSDGLLIPSPFVGGTEPIADHWTFNYTLPVQLNVQHHKNGNYLVLGVKTDGYRAGAKLGNARANMNYGNGCAFVNYRGKLSRTVQVYAEVGYNFYQYLSFDDGARNSPVWPVRTKVPMNSSAYVQVSLQVFFGKSLLEKVTDQLF